MKSIELTITITEKDLETLKGISISDDVSGIINHIYHLAKNDFDKEQRVNILTPIQEILLKGLIKGKYENINYPIPLSFFNLEYYSEIEQLERYDMIVIKELNEIKMIYLNDEAYDSFDTLEETISEYKKLFN